MDNLLQENRISHYRFLLGEVNIDHTSYRAEPLGWCTLHLHFLARAVAEFYKLDGWSAMLCCNNMQALEKSSNNRSRI